MTSEGAAKGKAEPTDEDRATMQKMVKAKATKSINTACRRRI